jgi:hypothetical protein
LLKNFRGKLAKFFLRTGAVLMVSCLLVLTILLILALNTLTSVIAGGLRQKTLIGLILKKTSEKKAMAKKSGLTFTEVQEAVGAMVEALPDIALISAVWTKRSEQYIKYVAAFKALGALNDKIEDCLLAAGSKKPAPCKRNPSVELYVPQQKSGDYGAAHLCNEALLDAIDARAMARGAILGRYIREPFADGHATYQVIDLTKTRARIRVCRGLGDDWVIPYWGEEASVDLDFVQQRIKHRDSFKALFSRKAAA